MLDVPSGREGVEWNEWDDANHIGSRLAYPGYLGRCFIATDGEPKYLTLYDSFPMLA